MLKAVSLISQKYGIACQASLEVKMACGFGACLGCAVKVTSPSDLSSPNVLVGDQHGPRQKISGATQEYRYAAACEEGPVFEASEILWD